MTAGSAREVYSRGMENLTTFTAVVLFVTTLITVQNFLRYLKARDWNGVLAILIAFLSGIVAVTLAAHSNVTGQLHLIQDGPTLENVDGAGLVMLGVAVGAAAPVLVDFIKSRDNSDSAAKPKLVGGPDA